MSTFNNFENKEMEYSLTVSQFAKLCGTTRDTLRYYYEQTYRMAKRYVESDGTDF